METSIKNSTPICEPESSRRLRVILTSISTYYISHPLIEENLSKSDFSSGPAVVGMQFIRANEHNVKNRTKNTAKHDNNLLQLP